MIRNVALARELGLLKVSDSVLLNEKELKKFRSNKVCIICTGSQAEPRAAVSMMSVGKHPLVEIGKNDTVIFSSAPIPGNEASIFRVHNNLVRLGARIVHSGKLKIHTTGHGKAGELLALHEASNPELFIPVHGEYTHLLGHEETCLSRGMDQSKILRCEDGDSVCLDEHGLHLEGRVSGEYLMVDVRGAEVSKDLVKERISLGGEGFILVRVLIDKKRRKLLEDPFTTSSIIPLRYFSSSPVSTHPRVVAKGSSKSFLLFLSINTLTRMKPSPPKEIRSLTKSLLTSAPRTSTIKYSPLTRPSRCNPCSSKQTLSPSSHRRILDWSIPLLKHVSSCPNKWVYSP
jgi:mRNA degradation ribonuclease J1/J2